MKRWAMRAGCAFTVLLVGACVSSGDLNLVRLSADTYRLSRVDGGGRYANAEAMKTAVINDANAFAKKQGKIAVPVEAHEETLSVGHLSTIDYDFRLEAPGVVAPKAVSSVKPPVLTAEPKAGITEEPKPAVAAERAQAQASTGAVFSRPAAKPDLYTELIRLDDLRRRGILTDEEFQTLKAKLIADK